MSRAMEFREHPSAQLQIPPANQSPPECHPIQENTSYYQLTPRMGNSYSNSGSSAAAQLQLQAPELPLHLCFFLLVLLAFLGFSWYASYESVAETFADQGRLLLMVSPLALLLAVRLLSGAGDHDGAGGAYGRGRVEQMLSMSMPERDSIHRAGGSPWGVGLLLVLLLVMVSYQSNFREKWFPLASR